MIHLCLRSPLACFIHYFRLVQVQFTLRDRHWVLSVNSMRQSTINHYRNLSVASSTKYRVSKRFLIRMLFYNIRHLRRHVSYMPYICVYAIYLINFIEKLSKLMSWKPLLDVCLTSPSWSVAAVTAVSVDQWTDWHLASRNSMNRKISKLVYTVSISYALIGRMFKIFLSACATIK